MSVKTSAVVVVVAVLAVFYVHVFAVNVGDAGSGNAVSAVQDRDYHAITDLKGEVWCPGKKVHNVTKEVQGLNCGSGSVFHYHNCCGTGEKECCFALQLWVYIVIGVLILMSLISTILGIVCCCCK